MPVNTLETSNAFIFRVEGTSSLKTAIAVFSRNISTIHLITRRHIPQSIVLVETMSHRVKNRYNVASFKEGTLLLAFCGWLQTADYDAVVVRGLEVLD
jgi:hypothetical protein